MKNKTINRVEVIDHTKSLEGGGGRAYVFWGEEGETEVETSIQDGGKTLKVVITPKKKKKKVFPKKLFDNVFKQMDKTFEEMDKLFKNF